MKYTIILIFILALIIRFAFFPGNVYFAYDQARDSYFAEDILNGDIRLIGPPSAASDKLFPGPLSLYIYSFIYFIFGQDPSFLSAFFRIYNALGVLLVFLIGSKLFDKRVGVISSLLFAVSYEQSQYSLFMSHQPLAVLPMLLLYLGLVIFLFEKKAGGLLLISLGLGLAIQFHFVYGLMIPIALVLLFINKSKIPRLNIRYTIFCTIVFLLTISTYIVAEFKFGFRMLKAIISGNSSFAFHIDKALYSANRFIHDTYLADYQSTFFILVIVLVVFAYYIWRPEIKRKALFLLIWFGSGILPYLLFGTTSYYYSAAASVSLLLFFSFLVIKTYLRNVVVGAILFLSVLGNNLFLIKTQNPNGPNKDIVIQHGMLLAKEKEVLDYIYQESGGKSFAVRALTIPLNVNTTWSYLFEWFGEEKYSYLPVWSEKPAEGFPGNLPYFIDRSRLPETQFVIIEPTVGIPEHDRKKFFNEEGYFAELVEERSFGTIIVQKRSKI